MTARRMSTLSLREQAQVVTVHGGGGLRLRLLEMGFVPGTPVTLVKKAPFGDPLEFCVRGSHLSLRTAEAALIEVQA